MYAYSLGRSGFNGAESTITPDSMSRLQSKWTISSSSGALITAQPVMANGLIYWGSWDGVEHATHADGTPAWTTNLGVSPAPPGCVGRAQSLLGSAAIAPVTINGSAITALFVAGGNDTFYALDATSGAVLWQRQVATPPADIWSSPVMYNGSVYTSTAGWGDCPGAQGQVFQLNAATGAIQNTFNVVPNGCIGGGVWGSITIDAKTNTLYFATGNDSPCSEAEPNAIALVQLRASDLTFMSAWQVPRAEHGDDGDFGSTPTLFTATIGGTLHTLLGVANKNGVYYAFDEAQISNGPVWRATVAVGGIAPETGTGSISPSAWDGTTLYVAGGKTTIGGQSCQGSVRALNPVTGAFIWQSCLQDGFVLGAVAAAPGVIAVGAGNALALLAASDGHVLAKRYDTAGGFNMYYGGPAIANGVVYIGNVNGKFHAYAPATD
jgi:polyvinyl alcohol dehydrogenase (cytochrome)